MRGDGERRPWRFPAARSRSRHAQVRPARHYSRRHAISGHALRRRALVGPGMVDYEQDARSLARGRLALLPAACRQPDVPPGPIGQHRGPGQRPGAEFEPRHLLPQRRADGRGRRRQPHGNLPDRCPTGQPGAARPLALFPRFCGPQAGRVRHALQQPLLDELRAVDRGFLVVAGPPVGDRRANRRPSSLVGNSWEARVACLAAVADAAPGKLPPQATRPGLEKAASDGTPATAGLSSRGPLVTAFGPNPYGEGTLVRFWEQAGEGGDFTFICPAGWMSPRPALRFAGPADRRADRGLSPGRVPRDDPAHGPGEFHPLAADATITARAGASYTSPKRQRGQFVGVPSLALRASP